MTEISLSQIRCILKPQFLSQLVHITICGNYGDAMSARDILAICQYIWSINPRIDLELHTNGSARPPEVWRELAVSISRCVFAIDGLEDTNHIYRQKTNWKNIMRNVDAFIGAGGCAEWNFIAFRHNEHQVSEAALLANDLGFRRFFVKRTGRFAKRGVLRDSYPIFDNSGNVIGKLEVPTISALRNPTADSLQAAIDEGLEYEKIIAETPIKCSVAESNSIYISAEGFVFPCCWMAQIYPAGKASKRKQQVLSLLQGYGGGVAAIDANTRSIEAIVGGGIFQIGVPNGWREGGERLEICARQCGQYRLSAAQKTTSLI